MNTWEIDEAVEIHRRHPVLGPATRILSEYRDTVNANSDGWAYWSAATSAANKLMALIQAGRADHGRGAAAITEAQLKKALTPLKAFCTKKNLPFPRLDDNETFDVNAVLVGLHSLKGHHSAMREGLELMLKRAATRAAGWVPKLRDDLEQLEVVLEQMAAESRQLRMDMADAKLEPAK